MPTSPLPGKNYEFLYKETAPGVCGASRMSSEALPATATYSRYSPLSLQNLFFLNLQARKPQIKPGLGPILALRRRSARSNFSPPATCSSANMAFRPTQISPGCGMNEQKAQEFVQLLAGGQRRLYAYIRPQVASPTDADDVMQQTSAVLWTKFESFEPGTNFVAWACRIARFEVLAHHRNQKKQPAFLSDHVAELLADDLEELVESTDQRYEALAACLQALPARDREMVMRRYESGANVKRIAAEIGRTESAVYKALSKIHDALFHCIEAKLAQGDGP